jgi:glutamyl-tRNA reductase
VLYDADAYALLLEIVCGLRSPLLGETEVHAQFKQFVAGLDRSADGWIRDLGERVLADAKAIRARHLQGFGVHSYGQLAARRVRGEHVALIGTGALANEVLRHLDAARSVDVWGRRAEALAGATTRSVRRLLLPTARLGRCAPADDDRSTIPGQDAGSGASVVIAAPVGEVDLSAVLAAYPRIADVVDLRAADQQTPIDLCVPLTRLEELLDEGAALALGHRRAAPAAAREEARRRAAAFARREQLRPFGWEDLCA